MWYLVVAFGVGELLWTPVKRAWCLDNLKVTTFCPCPVGTSCRGSPLQCAMHPPDLGSLPRHARLTGLTVEIVPDRGRSTDGSGYPPPDHRNAGYRTCTAALGYEYSLMIGGGGEGLGAPLEPSISPYLGWLLLQAFVYRKKAWSIQCTEIADESRSAEGAGGAWRGPAARK